MNTLTRTERVLIDAIDARVFPGGIVEVGSSTAAQACVARGSLTYEPQDAPVSGETIYDLASLTKVLCTATLALELVAQGALDLEDGVRKWCPVWTGIDRHAVTVRHLLEHASGLPAHARYFERLQGGASFEGAIATEPLEYVPGTSSLYSDLGFILLGFILERAGGAPLDVQFDRWRASSIGDAALRFHPPAEWLPRIAPTEHDSWRGRLLRGEVHDENAYALGGVAGHAGLFGTAAAVGACARWWMQQAIRTPTAAQFLRRGRTPESSRALGWDTMLRSSSCGTRMTASAAGHTGFSGTSLWIDPGSDRYVVCLTNRVHPSREGDAMTRVRPAIHDAVAEDFDRSN